MKKNSVFQIVVFLLVNSLLFFSACENEIEKPDPTTQEIIDQAVQTVRISVETEIGKAIPTLNVFIQTPNGSWFSSSAGEGYQPIAADTYFSFASNTKSFTASSALEMMQDGWLDLDVHISDTIPGGNIPYVPANPDMMIGISNFNI